MLKNVSTLFYVFPTVPLCQNISVSEIFYLHLSWILTECSNNMKHAFVIDITYFLLSSMYTRRKYCIRERFLTLVFDSIHVLGCPKHDLTMFRKCLSRCLSIGLYIGFQNFLDTVSYE